MTTPMQTPGRRSLWSWALYDFANSAFTTIVITFIFAIYFADTLACTAEWTGCLSDEEQAKLSLSERMNDPRGQALWGYSQTFITLLVAVLAPIFGGHFRPWRAAQTVDFHLLDDLYRLHHGFVLHAARPDVYRAGDPVGCGGQCGF